MSNLIVILFNFLYLVFIVGFNCKGCVWERERERERERESVCMCVKTQANWRLKSFYGYLVTKHPTKWCMCATHDWNAKSQDRWRQLCFVSSLRVRSSHETLMKHFVLPDYFIWYTLSVPTLYIQSLLTNVEECFWEKTLATNLES